MPLKKGKSKKVFSSNVKDMMNSGHPQKQSLAAAFSKARQSSEKGHKKGY